MQTHISLFFGDGEYLFKLGLRQIVAIEDKCGPIGEVFARLLRGRYVAGETTIGLPGEAGYSVKDCIEVIRQGLIGGASGVVDGSPVVVFPIDANRLIDTYLDGRPLKEAWATATAVLSALVEGYSPPDAGPDAPAPKKKVTRRKGSTGGPSSPVAP